MVICLERGAELHVAQLMPLPLTVSCFSEIQIGFTFLVQAYPGSPEKNGHKCVCVVKTPHLFVPVIEWLVSESEQVTSDLWTFWRLQGVCAKL